MGQEVDNFMKIDPNVIKLINLALREDIGDGDITSNSLFSPQTQGRAILLAKESFIVSGLSVAAQIFYQLDPTCQIQLMAKEGARIEKDSILAQIRGSLLALLAGERTALNFLCHLSGIATLTRRYVDALEGTQCKLLDTRKTTPGYRVLEKNAVLAGGGNNHRMGLFDSILIKDNHISAYGSITNAVKTARKNAPKNAIVEVECENLDQVNKAISAGAQMLLLDNMSCPMMAQAVSMTSGNVLTEASGGIHIDNIRQVAQTGVDYVSVGAITHSAPAIDISLELKKL